MKLILASNNRDKLREIRELLADTEVEILSQSEAGLHLEVEETGKTFTENARLKAEAAMRASGLPAVADDSGLEVNAMGGGPGIYSARYCGDEGYESTCRKIIANVGDNPDRGARFCCAVVCAFPNGDEISTFGVMEGSIARELRGENGFGYDPIFIPTGMDRTTAELSQEEKNTISHRGAAMRQFAEKWRDYYADK